MLPQLIQQRQLVSACVGLYDELYHIPALCSHLSPKVVFVVPAEVSYNIFKLNRQIKILAIYWQIFILRHKK